MNQPLTRNLCIRQKIEHAGYTRYILQPNPVRYDSEGDELDEDDEHSEADAAAAEENPFSEIALESECPIRPIPACLVIFLTPTLLVLSVDLFSVVYTPSNSVTNDSILL